MTRSQKTTEAEAGANEAERARFKAIGGSDHHPFNSELLCRVVLTAWPINGEPESRATLDRLARISAESLIAFHPSDEVEGMLAAQAVGLHNAAMEAMRRANVPKQPEAVVFRSWKEAASLSRAMVEAVEALHRWRGANLQGAVRDG